MFGGDPAQVLQNLLTWYGGRAGGLLLLVALVGAIVFAKLGVGGPRGVLVTFVLGLAAWGVGFFVRTWFGWAV